MLTATSPFAVNTNGSITEDEDMGEIIQLQGDQRCVQGGEGRLHAGGGGVPVSRALTPRPRCRQNVKEWLRAQEVVTAQEADRIVIHGF